MRAARQHDEKDTLPVVPWYWRDWRASRARAFFLTTKNWLGGFVYRELLDAHWGEVDCALPAEDAELAALAGVSLEAWLSVKDVVLRWLNETRDGRRQNPRAFREWKIARSNRKEHRKKAKTAAKARWEKEKARREAESSEHAPSIPQAIHKDSPSTPTPTPSPTPAPSSKRTTASAPVGAANKKRRRRPEPDDDSMETRAGCEDHARITGRPVDYSAAKLALFATLVRARRSRLEWCKVLEALRDRSVPAARFARDGDGKREGGPGLTWALRPGPDGGFDKILLQLADLPAKKARVPESARRVELARQVRLIGSTRGPNVWDTAKAKLEQQLPAHSFRWVQAARFGGLLHEAEPPRLVVVVPTDMLIGVLGGMRDEIRKALRAAEASETLQVEYVTEEEVEAASKSPP